MLALAVAEAAALLVHSDTLSRTDFVRALASGLTGGRVAPLPLTEKLLRLAMLAAALEASESLGTGGSP